MPDASHESSRREVRLDRLEKCAASHAAVFVIGAAWALGGNTNWSRLLLSTWGSLGAALLLAGLWSRRREGLSRHLLYLLPLTALAVLVGMSARNVSFHEITADDQTLLVRNSDAAGGRYAPSTASPSLSFQHLWFFAGAYLSGMNVMVSVRSRRVLRMMLAALAANAVALAVFGTVEALMHSPGPYFGAFHLRQPHFFSTFLYHNHWGSFAVLMTAALIGVCFHFGRTSQGRDFWHSPAPAAVVGVVFLAASIPLSTSRSCTVVVAALLVGSFVHLCLRAVISPAVRNPRTRATRVLLAIAVLIGATAFAYEIGRPVIQQRLRITRQQIAESQAKGERLPREALYRDTWRLAQDKVWFGWGMGSYPIAFFSYNTESYSRVDGLPHYYEDAHSDWLQAVAEVGIIGVALIGLCGALPLLATGREAFKNPISGYLFAGCGLILAYAWLEFPFGNRAVVVTFWVLWFAALRYAQLSRRAT